MTTLKDGKGATHERDEGAADEVMSALMRTLDPAPHRLAQIEDAVLGAVERNKDLHRKSLVVEWVELLRLRPIVAPTLTLAGATALVLLSPVGGVLVSLFS